MDLPGGPISPVELVARARYLGLFVAARVPLSPWLSLEAGLRRNDAWVRLDDRRGEALDGRHRFRRLNPGAEVDWEVAEGVTMRAGWHRTNRVPAPAELGCADPDAPCSLANFFIADPPLEQEVTESAEAGVALARAGWRLSVAAFRATSQDDIQLVASGVRGRGYFKNVGRTRRQGAEVTAEVSLARWLQARLGYALTDATFRTGFALPSPNHPAAEADGSVTVAPGDRLANVPRHRGVMTVEATHGGVGLGLDLSAQSGMRYQGDEIGALETTGRYARLDLRAAWTVNPAFELFAEVRNLTNTRASTFGILGEVGDVELDEAPGASDPRFAGPLAPRRWRLGARVRF
ncbi:MAG: TonB-dependent receptor [Sphingomonadaceae bacterium]|uniref:TonB-dependent receptor n=1 Tax=Thermaurantiacus sp. TaxID=2820283 RepID=UPI00298EF7C6|nr:TonB-dependent receptor [Thermaurantiacus sp.]MCS6986238.1 TonB-dependent receptor [Sphingomonadaceae bacterium]MDW8415685.1 TonB-dependent receptor [Thermaurantiacus sp.]